MKEIKLQKAKNGYVIALDGNEFGEEVVVCNHFDSLVTWLVKQFNVSSIELDRLREQLIPAKKEAPEPDKIPSGPVAPAGWKEPKIVYLAWRGGARPVDENVTVEYILRDGSERSMKAGKLEWDHLDESSDIVGYRTVA